ncbi:ectoine synthase [Salsipaludibacter albus]|uniref:ectoine synthase n=1 Tax=Salsipaludibacter albus TaxID=2849650 RepID=UPI001EE46FA5|nr:ectoine synthase [Salsipaludibacter albus]MBY5162853.1 ectoine synthase [Salsipaludibacter albus]
MIVRTLADTTGTDRETVADTWTSRRLLLADDRMGFSLHDTVLHAGTSTAMWYRNHVEAVYCIAGAGRLEDHETGEVHRIEAGTVYALDQHDRHTLHADTDLRMVCVFNPPVTGDETHDDDGAYPAPSRPAPAPVPAV